MSIAAQIGAFVLQWAVGTCLVGGVIKGTMGAGWIGGGLRMGLPVTLTKRGVIILLAVSATIALAAVTLLHLAT